MSGKYNGDIFQTASRDSIDSNGSPDLQLSSPSDPFHEFEYPHNDRLPDSTLPVAVPDSSQSEEQEYYQLSKSLPEVRHSVPPSKGRLSLHRTNSEYSAKKSTAFTASNIFSTKWLSSKKNKKKEDLSGYSIEYSVFKPVLNYPPVSDQKSLEDHLMHVLSMDGYKVDSKVFPDNYVHKEDFVKMLTPMVYDVENDVELKPRRVSQGSSGSYFIQGRMQLPDGSSVIIKRGIFKPKDEEPYGPLSPKWSKWLHRTFFPCFFGRSCLIPNLGYISEAAACVLDRQLLMYMVPYTDIIELRSDQFYHSWWKRAASKHSYKIGSFQCFLQQYVEAQEFFRSHPIPHDFSSLPEDTLYLCSKDEEPGNSNFYWSKELMCQFQEEVEKLVILDYIMRNTDRGADNWMIKISWTQEGTTNDKRRMYARFKIGAIDSGLAFPWKHPDEWRSFPFGWLFLPYSVIGQPFSAKTRQHFLPLLTSKYWWEQTTVKLKKVFQKDADFKERMWHKQIAVLKGQAFNVVEVLKQSHAGPLELTRREHLLIWDDTMNVPADFDDKILSHAMGTSIHELPLLKSSKLSLVTAAEDSETTPLLKRGSTKRKNSLRPNVENEAQQGSGQISGFDYNISFEQQGKYAEDGEGKSSRNVVIERLEKVYSKGPVFTWC